MGKKNASPSIRDGSEKKWSQAGQQPVETSAPSDTPTPDSGEVVVPSPAPEGGVTGGTTAVELSGRKIVIDPKLKHLLPPSSPRELALLEASLKQHGVLFPVVVQKSTGRLLDGFQRAELCGLNRIHCPSQDLDIPDCDVIGWIIANDAGRRKLSSKQESELRGRHYNSVKQGRGGRPTKEANGQNVHSTAELLAEIYKVSAKTITRDGEFADALEQVAAACGPEARLRILCGKSRVTRQAVLALSRVPAEAMPAALQNLLAGVQPQADTHADEGDESRRDSEEQEDTDDAEGDDAEGDDTEGGDTEDDDTEGGDTEDDDTEDKVETSTEKKETSSGEQPPETSTNEVNQNRMPKPNEFILPRDPARMVQALGKLKDAAHIQKVKAACENWLKKHPDTK